MEPEDSVGNPLERMLIDETEEPTNLPLPLLESITNHFSNDLKIGIGGFADVYKGQLKNGTIAVKKLTKTLGVYENKFNQEVDSLMRVRHKNIVRFLGYCSDTQGKVEKFQGMNVMAEERQRFLCFEFLPQGSLDKYISEAAKGLEWPRRYRIIKGICEGLHYLHQQNIVHLDLKPGNILLDYYMEPKIADFGLSKCFDEKQTRAMTSNVFGSVGYMAPEYRGGGVITFKSDIYSLGIIIIELLTGKKECPDIDNVLGSWSTRFETSMEDIQLEPVRVCAEVGIECTDFNPAKRPDTRRIIERLAELENSFMKTDLVTSSLATNPGNKVKLEIMGRVMSIPSTTSVDSFPVMVRVTAPPQYTESLRVGLDLVVVLHIISKNMSSDNRMKYMKEAMMFVIDNLGPNDRLSIVSGNNKKQRLTELSFMTDVNRLIARHEVRKLEPAGRTNVNLALNEAVKILWQRGERRNRVGRIIQLSDDDSLFHEDSDDEDNSTSRAISITELTYDFGLGADNDLLDLDNIDSITMADLYSYVTHDLEKTKDAIAQSLGGVMSVTAMDVQVNLQALDGVTILYILSDSDSYPTVMSSDKRSAMIQLPDLYAGEQKNFILYLTVPEGEQNQLLTMSGSYRSPKTSSKEATIQLDDNELAVQRPIVATTTPSDGTVFPDVAAELLRLQLVGQVWETIKGHCTLDELQRSWEDMKGSEDGCSAPQSAVLALDEDVAQMQYAQGERFMLSWLTSHTLQRATTKGSPNKSSAFRVKAMDEMIKKVDTERKRLLESIDSRDRVKLEIMGRVKSIPSTMRINNFPVLVRLTAPLQSTERSRAGLDLIAVLDISGSMMVEKELDSVKQAMMFVIDNLGPDDRLLVMSSNNYPQDPTELSIMTNQNRVIARQQVCMVVPRGRRTMMAKALNKAAKILRLREPEERRNRVGRIIFLSNGKDDDSMVSHYNSEIPVETFGLGDDHDLYRLFGIAKRTLGLYSSVTQDLEEIKDAVAQSLGGLTSVTAMDVHLNLETLGGVTISQIESGSYPNSITSDSRSGTIMVPDLYAGEQKNFTVYLNVPEGEQKRFMTVSGSYRNPKVSKESAIQLNDGELLAVTALRQEAVDVIVCPDVAAELIRLRLLEMIERYNNNNNIQGLQRLWEEVRGSEDGRNASQSAMLALDKDVASIQVQPRSFIYSWLSSHSLQRATTKESPAKSSAFRVKGMEEMLRKVDAERKRHLGGTLVHFDRPLAFTDLDLLCATAGVMGKSTYGTMYKTRLEDGSLVAVKVVLTTGYDSRFGVAQATVLGKIRHPNLLALRSYYLGAKRDKLLLFFDYMPEGSLSAFLHDRDPRSTPVNWATRMRIAKGTARGLAYLHGDMRIIHGNLTASNVLLDEQCNPKIADILMTTAAANSNVLVAAGALGYCAPEQAKLKKVNAKTDVYSLGVIILELLTGKSPRITIEEQNIIMDLPKWVASLVEEWDSMLFDMELMRQAAAAATVGDELKKTLKLALQCVDPSPSVRPEAREVLRQLEHICPWSDVRAPTGDT